MQTAAQLVESSRPLVIAHRGASDRAPENTLPAFEAALALGADAVELDYRHSADGVPVVFHDELLDKTTDASTRWGGRPHAIADFPVADLQRLDAGSWFAPTFRGTRIPTLAAAIELVCPRAILAIERKVGNAATLVKLLRELDAAERVAVMAFDWGFLAECRHLAPRLVTVALGDKAYEEEALVQAAGVASVVAWDVARLPTDSPSLIAAAVAAAHRRNLRLWAWTIDEIPQMLDLIAASIDGLITDWVDLALRAREQAETGGQ